MEHLQEGGSDETHPELLPFQKRERRPRKDEGLAQVSKVSQGPSWLLGAWFPSHFGLLSVCHSCVEMGQRWAHCREGSGAHGVPGTRYSVPAVSPFVFSFVFSAEGQW